MDGVEEWIVKEFDLTMNDMKANGENPSRN